VPGKKRERGKEGQVKKREGEVKRKTGKMTGVRERRGENRRGEKVLPGRTGGPAGEQKLVGARSSQSAAVR